MKLSVVPAKAGGHFGFRHQSKMGPGLRRDDGASAVQRFGQRDRFADEPALRVAAAKVMQDLALLAFLDALCDEAAVERARHRDDDTDERDAAWPVERAHERLVELDLIEVERKQRTEIRIAGAEVVERDVHTGRVTACEHFGDAAVIEHEAFGDFDLEPVRRQRALAELGRCPCRHRIRRRRAVIGERRVEVSRCARAAVGIA